MPRNINLLLDQLLVDPEYSVTTGNTEPNVLYGFFGKVIFKPWQRFNEVITAAITSVEGLNEAQLGKACSRLEQVREEISEKKINHREIEAIEDERNRLLVLGKAGGVTSNDERMERHRKKKKRKVRSSYIRKPVTSSTSIIDLHGDVMKALHIIIEKLYPNETLNMEQRMIYGEYIIDNTDVDSSCASERGNENEDVEELVEALGNDLDANIDEVSEPRSPELVIQRSAEHSTVSRTERVATERDGGGSSKGPRRSMRLVAKKHTEEVIPQTPPERNAIVKLRQAADKSLFRIHSHAITELPVCGFEFKGPSLDLSGLLEQDRHTSHEGGSLNNAEAESGRREEEAHVACIQLESGSENLFDDVVDNNVDVNINNEEVGRRSELGSDRGLDLVDDNCEGDTSARERNFMGTGIQADTDAHIYVKGASSQQVADKYNSLFASVGNLDNYSPNRPLLVLIIQVLCQAILTQSGCVVLTNHQTAIAFRLEENVEKKRAEVFVTGLIPSHREPGNLAAMLGIAKLSLDTAIGKTDEELLGPKRRILRRVSNAHYENYPTSDIEPLDKDWYPGCENDNAAQGSGHNVRSNSARRANYASHDSNPGTKLRESDPMRKEKDCNSFISDVSAISNVELNKYAPLAQKKHTKQCVERMPSKKRSEMDESLRRMFATTEGVIAVGGSGLLLRGIWDNTKAAVKLWNGNSPGGFLNIRSEIGMYKRMEKRCPSVFGDAIPRMLLGWDSPEKLSVHRKEIILITELVGHEIMRDRDGNLWVGCADGYEEVNERDARFICEAALQSLAKLHMNGFIHGDVALRNIRVEQRSDVNSLAPAGHWKAWWVDLGHAAELARNVKVHITCFET